MVCLSFDVEEWDPPAIYGVASEHSMSDRFSAEGCGRLLSLLGSRGVRCNSFATGVFARNCPDTVRELAEAGHEVGCHGNEHKPLVGLGYRELKAEVKAGRESVEAAAQRRVRGFRSPMNKGHPRLCEALGELGFAYDSSVHPAVLPGRLSDILQRRDVHRVGGLAEVPISTLYGLPISWWWMRNIGLEYTLLGCEASLRRYGYALLYFHPWEYTVLPEVRGVPAHITRGTGRPAESSLGRFIDRMKARGRTFGTIPDILEVKGF